MRKVCGGTDLAISKMLGGMLNASRRSEPGLLNLCGYESNICQQKVGLCMHTSPQHVPVTTLSVYVWPKTSRELQTHAFPPPHICPTSPLNDRTPIIPNIPQKSWYQRGVLLRALHSRGRAHAGA